MPDNGRTFTVWVSDEEFARLNRQVRQSGAPNRNHYMRELIRRDGKRLERMRRAAKERLRRPAA